MAQWILKIGGVPDSAMEQSIAASKPLQVSRKYLTNKTHFLHWGCGIAHSVDDGYGNWGYDPQSEP